MSTPPNPPTETPPTEAQPVNPELADASGHGSLWSRLRAPFAPEDIEKLPKPLKSKDDNKGRCENDRYSADGHYCGGWHARALHLDYVGHAGITMRLNDVLGPDGWTFEPYAETPEGLPVMTASTFYGRLTIMGVTKWDVAANFNGPQEALGDCLRRCAMRFGIGTYLWSKSEASFALRAATDQPPEEVPPEPHIVALWDVLNGLPENIAQAVRDNWPYTGRHPSSLSEEEAALVTALANDLLADPPPEQ